MAKYTAKHPPLPDKPGTNWVEKAGGLPGPIDAVARALLAKGWDESRAIATAVNHVKKVCATGRAFGGKTPVSAEARTKACGAVARWEAMKAKARSDNSIPEDKRRAIDLAFKRIDQLVVDMALGRDYVEFAFNPNQARDKMGKWRAVVAKVQKLTVGEKVKVDKSFEIKKVAASGPRKYAVIMKTPARLPDRRVMADTAGDAADAALGVSPAEAAKQVSSIRSPSFPDTPAGRRAKQAMELHQQRKRLKRKLRRARGVDHSNAERQVIELAVEAVDRQIIDLARPGLVQAKVQVKNQKGTTFTRTIWVRPKQAQALAKQKGGAKLSTQGAKVTTEQSKVLTELAKIPHAERPKGWQKLVKALVDPRHSGRLGPQKRGLLHQVARAMPEGSPLRLAAADALKADVPKGRKKKVKQKITALRNAQGKKMTQADLVALAQAQQAKKRKATASSSSASR